MDTIIIETPKGEVECKVVYEKGGFVVNQTPFTKRYDVTHVGTKLALLRFISKKDAISLCNEVIGVGLGGATMIELLNSPGWEPSIKITQKYLKLSRTPRAFPAGI